MDQVGIIHTVKSVFLATSNIHTSCMLIIIIFFLYIYNYIILYNFHFRWNDGVISVGKEGEPSAFLTYADPEPFGIGYFGVCTGWGASGEWLIEGKIIFSSRCRFTSFFSTFLLNYVECLTVISI